MEASRQAFVGEVLLDPFREEYAGSLASLLSLIPLCHAVSISPPQQDQKTEISNPVSQFKLHPLLNSAKATKGRRIEKPMPGAQ